MMRITCTNCDAQYEVDEGAIPSAGRDVQCSNCGHSWFQMHPSAEAEAEAEKALLGEPVPEETQAPLETDGTAHAGLKVVPEPVPATETPPEAETEAEVAAEVAADADAGADAPTPPPDTSLPRQRRAIDDSVLAVLREEAERETEARKAEAERGIEVQPDLGLVAAARDFSPVRDPQDKAFDEGTTDKPAQRRDLLPDIDMINSTLRAGSEAREDSTATPEPEPVIRTSGFRTGFTFMLVVGVVLLAVYVMAPRIAAAIPGTEPTLSAYIRAIDAGRSWLDNAMETAAQAIRGISG